MATTLDVSPSTGLVGEFCVSCACGLDSSEEGWLMLGFFCFNLGFIGTFSAPSGFTKEAIWSYRPDDGRWLYSHHGGPADLASVQGSLY